MHTLPFIARLTIFTVLLTISLFAFALVRQPQQFKLLQDQAPTGYCGNPGMVDPRLSDHPGEQIFRQNCKACHSLDVSRVGPALRYSFQTRDSVWFVKMITDPMALVSSGDTTAVKLFERYYQAVPPSFTAFTKQELTDLVEYLKLEGERN